MHRHSQITRTVCFKTPDGTIFRSKAEAKLHINRIVFQLQAAKKQLKTLSIQQKQNKQILKRTIEVHKEQLQRGYSGHQFYVSNAQRMVAYGADSVTIAQKTIQGLKNQLKGFV